MNVHQVFFQEPCGKSYKEQVLLHCIVHKAVILHFLEINDVLKMLPQGTDYILLQRVWDCDGYVSIGIDHKWKWKLLVDVCCHFEEIVIMMSSI